MFAGLVLGPWEDLGVEERVEGQSIALDNETREYRKGAWRGRVMD